MRVGWDMDLREGWLGRMLEGGLRKKKGREGLADESSAMWSLCEGGWGLVYLSIRGGKGRFAWEGAYT
jgi:hypothetical protein